MMQWIVALLLLVGGVLMLVAAVGVLRMPDVLLRMSATTKAVTLGAGCMLGAAAVHFGDLGISTRLVATIAFLAATAPVAAHMISRAAYLAEVPLWKGMKVDELRHHYDPEAEVPDSDLQAPTSSKPD